MYDAALRRARGAALTSRRRRGWEQFTGSCRRRRRDRNPFSRKSRSSGGQSGRSPSPIPCPCHGPKASRVIQTPGREFDSRRLFLILSGAHGRWPRATGHRSSTAIHRARRRRTSSHGPRGRGGADARRRDAGANPAGPGTIPTCDGARTPRHQLVRTARAMRADARGLSGTARVRIPTRPRHSASLERVAASR